MSAVAREVGWGVRRAAYYGKGHDKSPEGSHGIGAHSVEHAHIVLDILRLHCASLVIGHVGARLDVLLVDGVDMFYLGGLGLDLCGVPMGSSIDGCTHADCLLGRRLYGGTSSMGQANERLTRRLQ